MKRKFKLLFLGVIAVFMLSLLCISASATSSNAVLGDMNGDSVVNIDDAIYLLKHTMMPSRYPVSQPADVNGTGDVNIDDAIYLLKHTMLPSRYPITIPGTYYTITWENDDGTVLKTTLCAEDKTPAFGNETPRKPSDAQYDYTFSGWSPELKPATEDTTYVAVYTKSTRSSYTITYHANGGTNVPASQIKTKGAAVSLSSAIPTNSGKHFNGWLCVNDGKTYPAGASFVLDADAELYAIWEITCYGCKGVGSITSIDTCGTCYGDGIEEKENYVNTTCTNCSGLGKKYTNCSSCKGFGKLGNCSCSCGNTWSPNTTGSRVCSRCGKTVTMQTIGNCGWCQGAGGTYSTCYRCGGDGIMAVPNGTTSSTCSSCGGSGSKTNTKTCSICTGDKSIVEYNTYTVTLKDENSTISTVSVTVNSPYTLTVPTKSGYAFLGWFDAAKGGKQYTSADGKPLSVWLDFSDKILYARWKINTYTISTNKNIAAAGSVSGDGSYAYGKSVTVKAATNQGYTFLGWYENGSNVSSDESYTFTSSANRSLEARWQINTYTISATTNISTAGSVSGSGNYDYGTSVTVTATTNVGYTFLGWYENGSKVSSNESYTFIISANKTLEARWQINTYTVSVIQNITEGGTVSSGGTYDYGNSITVKATTNTGFTFVGWYKNGSKVSSNASYTFTMPASNITLEARWQINVSTNKNISAAGSVSGSGNYDYGSSVTVKATTNMGYTFIGWYENSSLVSSNTSYTFTASESKSLEARWKLSEEYSCLADFEFTMDVYSCKITGVKDKTKSEYIIPDYVTSIGTLAFANCTELKNIVVPDSVKSIGSSAFIGCASLESITLPFVGGSVKTSSDKYQYPLGYIFGTSSYTGGVATEQLYWGKLNYNYSYSTYYIPSTLKSVTITGGNILSGAFYNCSSLTSVEIGDGVTSIGHYAFYDCTSLTSITIPDSMTSISTSAFNGCATLFYAHYNNGKYLGNSSNPYVILVDVIDTTAKSFTIPDTTKLIYSEAFSDCTSLTSITIPDGVTRIGEDAFSDCTSLTSVTIGNGVTRIDSSAFYNCKNLTSVHISDVAAWCAIEFYSNPLTYAGKLYLNEDLVTELAIPNSVTSIGEMAFCGCTSLTSIVIPDSVTSIGESAFCGCTGLTSITIPDSIRTIGEMVFCDCTSLTSITIPNSVTRFDYGAFANCTSLTNIKYRGTSSQWSAISKGTEWDYNTGSYTITYNYTGE